MKITDKMRLDWMLARNAWIVSQRETSNGGVRMTWSEKIISRDQIDAAINRARGGGRTERD